MYPPSTSHAASSETPDADDALGRENPMHNNVSKTMRAIEDERRPECEWVESA